MSTLNSLDGQGFSRYTYRGTKLLGWENFAMWDAEFQDYITMIPGLLPHFNGTAVKPLPEQESAGKGISSFSSNSPSSELWK